jgi:hypothetical protein
VVCATTGHTFGGFADSHWISGGGSWTRAGGSFLFLVENPHNDAPACFDCKARANAFLCAASLGPYFENIRISSSDAVRCRINLGSHYSDTLGRGPATFTGAKDFTYIDYIRGFGRRGGREGAKLVMRHGCRALPQNNTRNK